MIHFNKENTEKTWILSSYKNLHGPDPLHEGPYLVSCDLWPLWPNFGQLPPVHSRQAPGLPHCSLTCARLTWLLQFPCRKLSSAPNLRMLLRRHFRKTLLPFLCQIETASSDRHTISSTLLFFTSTSGAVLCQECLAFLSMCCDYTFWPFATYFLAQKIREVPCVTL